MVDVSLLQVLRLPGASCARINNPRVKKRKTRVSEFKWLPAKRLGQPVSDGTAAPTTTTTTSAAEVASCWRPRPHRLPPLHTGRK